MLGVFIDNYFYEYRLFELYEVFCILLVLLNVIHLCIICYFVNFLFLLMGGGCNFCFFSHSFSCVWYIPGEISDFLPCL